MPTPEQTRALAKLMGTSAYCGMAPNGGEAYSRAPDDVRRYIKRRLLQMMRCKTLGRERCDGLANALFGMVRHNAIPFPEARTVLRNICRLVTEGKFCSSSLSTVGEALGLLYDRLLDEDSPDAASLVEVLLATEGSEAVMRALRTGLSHDFFDRQVDASIGALQDPMRTHSSESELLRRHIQIARALTPDLLRSPNRKEAYEAALLELERFLEDSAENYDSTDRFAEPPEAWLPLAQKLSVQIQRLGLEYRY